MKEVDVALIAPNTLGFYKFSGKNRENLAIGVLGAYLEQNDISFDLIDARLNHMSQNEVLDELIKLRPSVVGLTLMGQEPALWSAPLISMVKSESKTWERLRQAGLHQVFFGIENGTEKVKRYIGKASSFETDMKAMDYLKSFGINVTYGFIMINPWSDINDIKTNSEILRKIGNAGLDKYFSELILTPSTKAYRMVEQEFGIVIEKVDGVDMYSYPLPQTIENIRKVSRQMLENNRYRGFLERIAAQYSRADQLLGDGQREASRILRTSMDTLSFNVFTKITETSETSQNVFSAQKVDQLLNQIIENFSSELASLEH